MKSQKSETKFFNNFLKLSPMASILVILTILLTQSSTGFDNNLRRRNFQMSHNEREASRQRFLRTELNILNIPRNRNGGGGGGRRNSRNGAGVDNSVVNQIRSLDSSLTSRWDASTSVCQRIPGLTREQLELCLRTPDATEVAVTGIQMGLNECGHQMAKHRWNCSSLQGNLNPHNTNLLQKGYRESAFGHAIAAAGVTFAVAKACSQGKLLSCGCGFQYDDQKNYYSTGDDPPNLNSKDEILRSGQGTAWKWAGCSHNMDYGMRFAKKFLDSRERSTDLPSRINLHNNRVGRLAVASNMEVRCKCHGLSGSCELRTCWRSSAEFRRVGAELKNKFRQAVMIDQTDFGNRAFLRNRKNQREEQQQRRKRRGSREEAKLDLWYYEKSPQYCDPSTQFGFPGTSGRRCNRTEDRRDAGSCSTLCCGRGYSVIRQVTTTRCKCLFKWCCEVVCQNCTVDEWITVCK